MLALSRGWWIPRWLASVLAQRVEQILEEATAARHETPDPVQAFEQ